MRAKTRLQEVFSDEPGDLPKRTETDSRSRGGCQTDQTHLTRVDNTCIHILSHDAEVDHFRTRPDGLSEQRAVGIANYTSAVGVRRKCCQYNPRSLR